MSEYLDYIDQEYDTAAKELGRLFSEVILRERGLVITGLEIGDNAVQPFTYSDSNTGMLMLDIVTQDNNITNISVWSDIDELKSPLAISVTPEIEIAYCKMMNGVHLWHAHQMYMSSPLPALEYRNHINNQ